MWADTTYKLTKVTSVEDGGLYVFENNYNNVDVVLTTVSSKTVASTTDYKKTGLAGTESYIWTLEAVTGGYYLKMSDGKYLNNTSGTDMSAGTSGSSVWIFNFSNGLAKIENTSNLSNNHNRYLANNKSNAFKAYAADEYNEFTVYKLEEEAPAVPHTVTLGDGGTLTEGSAGSGVTLPSRSNVADYTFVGWSETNYATETTTVPVTTAAGEYHPASDITLYPVYRRTISDETIHSPNVRIGDYAGDHNWENATQYENIDIDENITATATGGDNTGKYYTTDNTWRLYQNGGGNLKISASAGYELISVTISFSVNDNGVLKNGSSNVTSGSPISVSGSSITLTTSASSGSKGKVFVTAITVRYKASPVIYYTSIPVSTGTITLNADCTDGSVIYGSYYTNRAYIMPEYMVGQVVSVDDEGILSIQDAYEEGDVVPAYTALLLYTIDEFTGTKAYTISYTTGGDDFSDYNMLKGTLTADDTTEGDDCLFYRLTMQGGTQIGFWWGAANGEAFKPGANKAYLAVPKGVSSARGFAFDGESTGISTSLINSKKANSEVYSLSGQRIAQPTKGLYIVNGKKVVIK